MPSGLQRGLKGGHEVLSLLHGRIPVLSRNASGTAGQCTVHQASRGLLASEAEWTINRNKLKTERDKEIFPWAGDYSGSYAEQN